MVSYKMNVGREVRNVNYHYYAPVTTPVYAPVETPQYEPDLLEEVTSLANSINDRLTLIENLLNLN